MRVAFFVVLLAGAIFYSYVAYADLNFLTRTGRPGPGFFPRLIGTTAIIFTLWTHVEELRKAERERTDPRKWKDVVILMALACSYAVLLKLFGGFVATVIFLGATLMLLNRAQPIKNVLVATLVQSGVYLLFDRVLNANMPPALFELPI